MFYLASPDGQQQLLAYLKAWVKWTTLLPALMPLGAMVFLAFLAALLSVPAGEATDIILKGLVESYISLAVPVTQFWIAAYLLAALFFVTGWESARPASWRLPLLFLLPWYRRLRGMLPAVPPVCALSPANIPALDRSRFFPFGPPGLTPPALRAGNIPLRE